MSLCVPFGGGFALCTARGVGMTSGIWVGVTELLEQLSLHDLVRNGPGWDPVSTDNARMVLSFSPQSPLQPYFQLFWAWVPGAEMALTARPPLPPRQ